MTFSITRGNFGYRMKFANGWAISVQWGSFNYCQRRGLSVVPDAHGFYNSPNAEVAVFNAEDKMVRVSSCDNVLGWQSPDQVAALIARVASGTFVEPEEETA